MKPLGQLLKEIGLITEEHIQIALQLQQLYKNKLLGEILVELDFVTSDEIAKAVAIQNNLEYIDLDNIVPDKNALLEIPKDFALSVPLLPIKIENNNIYIAIENPNDLSVYDNLRKLTTKNIVFLIADKYKIAKYSLLYYYQLENPIEERIKKEINSNNPNIVEIINLILQKGIKDRATDIHITPEILATHIFYRIDGVLHHQLTLPKNLHPQIVSRIKLIASMNITDQLIPQDGSFEFEFLKMKYDMRVSTLPTKKGENVVLRILNKNASLFNINNLGFEEDYIEKIKKYFNKPYGIILITGPTGSGKTTTLYSSLRTINQLHKNILTIEDPVEYRFTFIKQSQINPKAGFTFASAIKSFMRQDPDVMLIGEIRDSETAELSIRASITGHLVLSTLHTNDSISSISRLEDLGVKTYLIAEGLKLVISQRLIRKLCPYCKKSKKINKNELLKYDFNSKDIEKLDDEIIIYEAVGCEKCNNTGYLGRIAVAEFFEVDDTIKKMIEEGKNSLEIKQKAIENGMRTLKEDTLIKILKGITTLEELKRVVE